MIKELAERSPNMLAMVDVEGGRRSIHDVNEEIGRWSAALSRVGIRAGHMVFTMLPNSFASFDAWLGVSWLRAIEVPANTSYLGPMLSYTLNNSEATVAIIAERYLDRLQHVAGDLTHLRLVVVPDASVAIPDLPFDVITGEQFFAGDLSADVGDGPEYYDISAMIYTSGTTGPSKGVLVPWPELYQFVSIQPPDTLDPGRGYYSPYPTFHISGKSTLYFTALRGGYVVIREKFSPKNFWSDVRTFDCQSAGILGPMASMLMRAPASPDDSTTPLETVFMGPLIPEVDEFKSRFNVRVGTGFGMTEVGAPLMSDGFNLVNSRSCGRRRSGPPGYQVRVVDEHDEPVPAGTVGEFVVRSDDPWVINAGYWRMPEKTADAWRNGWFHTGDAFMEDEDGNFYFVDRIKDAIRRSGENISSFEVEAGISSHPTVLECAVIGVPSELGEEEVKAVIVLRQGEALEPQELIEFLVLCLPRHMIPRYVEFAASLPKTDGTFRTQKVKLRENALNERTWDRVAAGITLPNA
jgi:crotonobetaine/carnitine-CoA ligase